MTAIEFGYQLTSLEDNLSRFARSLTLNREDARDLLQETMLKALRSRDQFAESTNLRAWTFTIMKNTFINNYRKHIHQKTIFDQTPDLHFLSQNRDTIFEMPDTLYSAKQLTELIDGLGEEYRTPLKMHIAGYKYKEIAEHLGPEYRNSKEPHFYS